MREEIDNAKIRIKEEIKGRPGLNFSEMIM